MLDSAPEAVVPSNSQSRHARPHRNVGPPKFFGDCRFIDVVLEKDFQPTFPPQMDCTNQLRATFVITSPSDLLTPLAEAPPLRTLVAETTLTWSSKKSCPSDRPNYTPIMSLFKSTSSGSHSSFQPTTNDTLDEVEKSSEISSTIDSEVKAELDEFDEQFNWFSQDSKKHNLSLIHLIVLVIDHFSVDNVVHVKCTSFKLVFFILSLGNLFLSQFLYNCKFCMFTLYICTFLFSFVDNVLLAALFFLWRSL